jgi:hypothetical protein
MSFSFPRARPLDLSRTISSLGDTGWSKAPAMRKHLMRQPTKDPRDIDLERLHSELSGKKMESR